MHADRTRDRLVVRRSMRAWVAAGVDLARACPPDGDPDRLLTHPDCRIRKFQKKVVVGEIRVGDETFFVKRYNVWSWRVQLASAFTPSPAFRAFETARRLGAHGFGVPDVVAAVEFRRSGVLRRSFFVTRAAPGATADVYWQRLAEAGAAPEARRARRTFVRMLGTLFGGLHAAGVYHADLKDVNILVHGPADAPQAVLLDLERVTFGPAVPHRRRQKNLVQLERTLGRLVPASQRLRFLAAYLRAVAGDEGGQRIARRTWSMEIRAAAARKDRTNGPRPKPARPSVTCTVVCQDEGAQIEGCLETVRWCDEIVVVDGGSRDDTPTLARRFTDRVFDNPWPGYVKQKRFALEQATSDWVLNLDADERVTPELATEIEQALGAVPDDVDGFAIPRLVSYVGRWWYRGGWYPRPVVRLVRRAHTEWGGTDPHDRAEIPGKVVHLREAILHYTYDDVSDHLSSVRKLTAVAADQVARGRHVGAARLLGEPAWRFLRTYFVKRGLLEGFPGFFLAGTDAFYTFLRWARVWERERRRP